MSEPRPFALFRNNFLPGSETFIHDELRHHVRYRGTVFARRIMNPERFPGHEVISLDQGPGGQYHPASLLYLASGLSSRFFAEIARREFCLVHAHFGHNGVYALPYVRRYRLPLVVSLHGRDVSVLTGPDRYDPRWWYYVARKQQLFDHTTLFLAASTELKSFIVEAGCPEEKVVIHRLGIDLTRFRQAGPDKQTDGPPVVVMVGRFVEKKGFRYGVSAFGRVVRSGVDARLTIIGRGPEEGLYRQIARELNVEDRITFTGSIPASGVADWMARAAVVVTPSVVASNMDRESGLIVAKEASATGVPVVGTWHGGIPEIIEDGVTGYLVPERNAVQLSEAMADLLTDPDRRLKMGRAGRAKMEKEYDIRKRSEALEKLYDSVAL